MAYSAETCSYSPHSEERQLGQWKLSLTTMYLSYYNYNTQIYKKYIAEEAEAQTLPVFASCKKPKYGAFLKAVFVPLCKNKSIFTQIKVKLKSCPGLISEWHERSKRRSHYLSDQIFLEFAVLFTPMFCRYVAEVIVNQRVKKSRISVLEFSSQYLESPRLTKLT